jgi:hypothetical protein
VATRGAPRRRRGRRVAVVLVLLLLVLGGVGLAVASRGTYETFPRALLHTPAQQATAPAWTRPCWSDVANAGATKHTCAHIEGRIVWVQKHDPDGDGDRHFLVVVLRRVRIVKITKELGVTHLPSIGMRVDATGYLMLGGSGHTELDALEFTFRGRLGL